MTVQGPEPDGLPRPPLWMRMLPRRFLSRLFGWLARRRWPAFLLDPFVRWYCGHYRVNRLEMAEPLDTYRTFIEFFTRPLHAGARPQDPALDAITSCADGRVQRTGTVEDGTALQVKGIGYSIAALLGSEEDATPFDGGDFHVVYLSPGDYHRFHWPWSGRVERVRHLPGDLWPVNDAAVASVPALFAQNERIAVLGRTTGGHAFAYIPVGALNVGSIRLTCLDLRTNRRGQRDPTTYGLDVAFERGDEAGRFELGSTIVLLLERGGGSFLELEPGTALQVGERIGTLA